MPFPPKQAQTRIKHAIVREYVGAWCGIIAAGIGRLPVRIDFAYAEGFAGKGQFERDLTDPESGPVPGSPVIALSALRTAADGPTSRRSRTRLTGILVEKDPDSATELAAHLRTHFGERLIREVASTAEAELGRISVVQDDFRLQASGVVACLPETAFLLAFIDPFGTSGSFAALSPLLRRPRTDLIIYFPSHDVQLYGAGLSSESPSPQSVANMQRVTDVYGSEEWMTIAGQTHLSVQERIDRYAALYQQRLRSAGRDCWVKSIALRFSASPLPTPGYHLFLVTEDADGAMRMNDILRKAEIRKHVERLQDMEHRLRERGNLELPFDSPFQATPSDVDLDIGVVADDVCEALATMGGRLEWKQLKGRLADCIYREVEIKKALKRLRDADRIKYSTPLRKSSIIELPDN